MDESLLDIVDRMLRFRRSLAGTRGRFQRTDPRLLSKFQNQLELILESYGKFAPTPYKTHSVRDQGVDIVIRSDEEGDRPPSLIGFQLKSGWDLTQPDYMQKLKAQHFESHNIRGLRFYYIVLCVDEKQHERRINMIEGEFKNAALTKIIEPEYVDTFLSLEQRRIDSYIKRVLANGDVVLKKASEIVTFPSRTTGALVIYLAVQQHLVHSRPLTINEVKQSASLRDFHERLLEHAEFMSDIAMGDDGDDDDVIEFEEFVADFEDQIVQDLETLRDDVADINGDAISIEFDRVAPLLALGVEALVRFEYEKNAIAPYLWELLELES